MKNYQWYAHLKKPRFAPPSWLFAPVWSVLYVLIAVSFGTVWYKALYLAVPAGVLLPFLLNILANFAFVPLQFRLKNNYLAAADILLVLGTLIVAMVRVYRYLPWVTYINLPYALWVSYATVLQLCIVWLNRPGASTAARS